MNIEESKTPTIAQKMYVAEFELDPANGMHEAYIAVNAIAGHNAARFVDVSKTQLQQSVEALQDATAELLDSGADQFFALLQQKSREKSREGVLSNPVAVSATESHLSFLHGCLIKYREETVQVVCSEMKSNMGNVSGLVRTLEAITADTMVHTIEQAVPVEPHLKSERPPIGFARVLVQLPEIP